MAYRGDQRFYGQTYEKQLSWELDYEDFKLWEWLRKMLIKTNTEHNNKELKRFGFSPTVLLIYIFKQCQQLVKAI